MMTSDVLQVRHVAAGYGGIGPATPAPNPDLYLVLFIDIQSSARLGGIELADIQLLDAAGNAVARAQLPSTLRRDLGEMPRGAADLADHGSASFDGACEPGRPLRLRFDARVDTRAESLKALPARYRARVRALNSPGATVEGPLHRWASG